MRRLFLRFISDTPQNLLLLSFVIGAGMIRWGGELTEMHVFRQSQTALSVYWMLRDGVDFLRPPLPIFGIEHLSVPMEFPLYQALSAMLAHILPGTLLEKTVLACRLINFASFLGCGYAFFRIVKRYYDKRLATTALVFFLFLPYPLAWAGVISIEYLTLLLVLVYCELLLRLTLSERFDWRLVPVTAIVGSLAILSKVTTILVYGPAIAVIWLYWVFWSPQKPRPVRVILATMLTAVVPFFIGYLWVHWSDAIKAQSSLTYFLTSAGSAEWNFGTLTSRLSIHNWSKIASYWAAQIFAIVGIGFATWGGMQLWRRDRSGLLLLALPPFTAVAVFFNLYWHHNYYHLAILPSLTFFMAYGFEALLAKASLLRRIATMVILIISAWSAIGLQMLIPNYDTPYALLSEFRFIPQAHLPARQRDLVIVDALRRFTKPDNIAMVAVEGWPSTIPFLAERRVLLAWHCEADLKDRPHLDSYVIDTKRATCPNLSIPKTCQQFNRDGIVLGSCLHIRR